MKKEIRILEVYYEPSISGITRHIGQYVIALKETEFKFYILCSTNDKKIIDFVINFRRQNSKCLQE